MKNEQPIEKQELRRVRHLAKLIRELKLNNYDSFTWESAIDNVLSKKCRNEDDFFRMKALMAFFIDEERRLCPLSLFMEQLDSTILNLKEKSKDYALSESDRRKLDAKLYRILSNIKPPIDRKTAFDFYQLLIDKVFLTNNLDSLFRLLEELSTVLNQYYENAFIEVHILVAVYRHIDGIIQITTSGATKKEIISALSIDADIGLFMNRLVKIGVFKQSKKGRENLYTFVSKDFDTNLLRKDWTWLWATPYQQLSLKIYERANYAQLEFLPFKSI